MNTVVSDIKAFTPSMVATPPIAEEQKVTPRYDSGQKLDYQIVQELEIKQNERL